MNSQFNEMLGELVRAIVKEELAKIKTEAELNLRTSTQTETQRYMNQKEVCKYLGKSPATINKWVRFNDFPVVEPTEGGNKVYDRHAVEKWINERTY